ncbi:MAG: hypothetical protein AAGH64_04860, partial [Planctomycetota bacterium]
MTTTRDQTSIPLHAPVEVQPKQGAAPKSSVMLSPRVVDEKAFDDFAGRLRSLLDEASTATQRAEGALTELRSLGSANAITRQKTLIEAGAKLVKAVEATTARLQAASADADATLSRIDAAAEKADGAVASMEARLRSKLDEQLASFERRVDERVTQITSQIETSLEARVADVGRQLERITETHE